MNTLKLFLLAIGIVLVIEGMPYALFPAGMKKVLMQLPTVSDRGLRIFGILAAITGFIIILWTRS